MAYKLVCVHEFHDHHTGEVINRGQEIHDYDHIAKLYHGNREHHFVKVALLMADGQWDWPPVLGVKSAPSAEAEAPLEDTAKAEEKAPVSGRKAK